MSDVILVNRTKRPRRMLVLNLTKEIAAVKVTNRTTEEDRQGTRRKRISTKLVGDSIRIPAGSETAPLPKSVLTAPDVKRAIDAREIQVRALTPAESTARAQKAAKKVETPAKPKPRRKKNGNGGDA